MKIYMILPITAVIIVWTLLFSNIDMYRKLNKLRAQKEEIEYVSDKIKECNKIIEDINENLKECDKIIGEIDKINKETAKAIKEANDLIQEINQLEKKQENAD